MPWSVRRRCNVRVHSGAVLLRDPVARTLRAVGLTRRDSASQPSALPKAHPYSLPANAPGRLSKSSYGNCAVSKKAGRTGKYRAGEWRIVSLVEAFAGYEESSFVSTMGPPIAHSHRWMKRPHESSAKNWKRCGRRTIAEGMSSPSVSAGCPSLGLQSWQTGRRGDCHVTKKGSLLVV
jgi:hypothetical protein